jgi:hypothetical protein
VAAVAISFRDELVRVYARPPLAAVAASESYQKLLNAHGEDPRFKAERNTVEMAAGVVEDSLKPPKTQAEQVQAALELLISARRDASRDLYRALILAGYADGWTAPQQAYFAAAWPKITARYDFFVSFTSRYEDVPGDNTINTAYEYFIRDVLGPDEIRGADRKRTNLLASAVRRLLTRAPSVPFFFPHFQYDNTNTEEKLRTACEDSLVLVQLVRNIMFVPPGEGRRNWCHYEYTTVFDNLATAAERSHRILFVVAENEGALIKKLRVPPPYRAWHTDVADRDPPYLFEMDTYDRARIAAAKKLLTEKVRPLLERPLFRLLEEVPA